MRVYAHVLRVTSPWPLGPFISMRLTGGFLNTYYGGPYTRAADASLVTLSTVTSGRVVVVLFRHCL